MINLSKQHIATIKDAAKKLTGATRREFQAQVSIDYLNSKPHLAEKIFGWDRKTVTLGLEAPHAVEKQSKLTAMTGVSKTSWRLLVS